jgi:predicted metal-binding protein
MAEKTTIHVCITCRSADDTAEERAGARLYRNVRDLAAERGDDVAIVPVECLSVCKRPVTFGFAAPGKWTYVYADAPAETAATTILDGAALYAAAPDGLIPWKQRPDALKKGVVSRVPPLSAPTPALSPETLPEAAE